MRVEGERQVSAVLGRRRSVDGAAVPLLRGRIHQASVLPVAAAVVVMARLADDARGRIALVVFGVSVVAMLSASAYYHCHAATLRTKIRARKLDHAMIFVAIAGTQTAYWMLAAPAGVAVPMVAASWAVALSGVWHKVAKVDDTNTSGSWLYTVLGWTGVAIVPFLWGTGPLALAFVALGGVVYTVGAVLLFSGRPNPWPSVVGHHELWHAMVVLGVVAHAAGLGVLTHAAT